MKILGKLAMFYFVLIALIQLVKSDSVCTLETLRREISEDLADNNKLDCLLVIKPPNAKKEEEEVKNKRILAQWDSSCSFESDNPWMTTLTREYGIQNLVDVSGEPVPFTPNDNEADLCQIIRTMIAKGLFDIKDRDMKNLKDEDIIYKIDCPGPLGDTKGPKICAASSGSFYNKGLWSIFLTSSAIEISKKPQFEKDIRSDSGKKNTFKDNFDKLASKVKQFINEKKDSFIKNGGSLLDKFKKAFNRDNQPPRNEGGDPSKVEFILKDIKLGDTNTKANFSPVTESTINLEDKYTNKSIFVFYNISLKTPLSSLKLNVQTYLNGNEKTEGRVNLGPSQTITGSGAYTANIFKGDNLNSVFLKYKADSNFGINAENDSIDSNFNIGVLIFPQSKVYTSSQNDLSKLITSKVFTETEVLLNLQNDGITEKKYLVFYGVSGKSEKLKNIIGTGLSISGESDPINKESVTISGSILGLSNHGCAFIKLSEQETKVVTIKYTLLNPFPSSHIENSLSLSAIEIPQFSIINSYPFDPLPIASHESEVTFNLTADKVVLIVMHINLIIKNLSQDKSNPSYYRIKMFINQVEKKRSNMMFSNTKFLSGTNYLVEKLGKGKCTIKFKVETNVNSLLDSATYYTGATLRVIEF